MRSHQGRTSKALEALCDELGKERCQPIEAVCIDRWAPCVDAIKACFPYAMVRKEEARGLKAQHSDLLKKTRCIWLKKPWNLTGKQKISLGDLEKLNLRNGSVFLVETPAATGLTQGRTARVRRHLVIPRIRDYRHLTTALRFGVINRGDFSSKMVEITNSRWNRHAEQAFVLLNV